MAANDTPQRVTLEFITKFVTRLKAYRSQCAQGRDDAATALDYATALKLKEHVSCLTTVIADAELLAEAINLGSGHLESSTPPIPQDGTPSP